MTGRYSVLERGRTNAEWCQVGAADSRRHAEVLAKSLKRRGKLAGKLATPMVALADR